MPALLLGLAGLQAPPAAAQNLGLVVRDGTLGTGPLEIGGTDPGSYLITPEMGQQSGSNLFHSFLRFSIGTNETATFTGPDGIDNVISRVTGGYTSQIDGTLRSTIPGASVWLLNPSGVVFGAGAKLEVPASFHVATADYLGFEGGLERFYADPTVTSVLATARPAAFGFLPENPGSGASASIAVDSSHLAVDPGETLELAGGDVSLTLNAELVAPGGDVRLEAQDTVGISQSLVDVGRMGEAPGTISIRGGKIVIEKSSLVSAENESGAPPSDPDAPGPGTISVAASESVLVDASLLSVSTHGAGNAGTIDIASPEIILQQGVGFDPLTAPQ